MLGTCAQCDESNVVVNVPRIRNILLYKNKLCFSQKDGSVQNMQSHKSKASTDAAMKVKERLLVQN